MGNTPARRQMVQRRGLSAALVLAMLALGADLAAPQLKGAHTDDAARAGMAAAFADLPLAFEPNLGQAGGGVSYLVHHGRAVTAFSSGGTTTSMGGKQVTMALTGAAEQDFSGTDELPSKTNYFLGSDQSKWQSDIPNYGKLLAKDVYPGIDLAYYGTNSQLEHDFIVSPGADYKQIAFGFTGQDDLSLNDQGNLVLHAGDETLTLNAPVTYQAGEHEKHTIPSRFELNDGTVTVAVADTYDPAKPLIIDPALVYSTYLGGSGSDTGYGIAVDANGNAYVVGSTDSSDFPTASPYQGSNAGGTRDVFVAKLNAAGSALVYATYLGGSADDSPSNTGGIAVDGDGNAYLAGLTSSTDFPTSSPYQASRNGSQDAFVTKLNAAGSALVYSTYLGGSSSDLARGIAVDAAGSAYVAGDTLSSNFPTVSPIQGSYAGGIDAFAVKFNAAGSALTYATYLGGGSSDSAYGIAVDAGGNAYLSGTTTSTDFPTSSPYQGSSGGGQDAFVTKLNAAGSALVYSTYLGGSGSENGQSIAVDGTGSAYVTGFTGSSNFPMSSPFQGSLGGGGIDAFVTKLDSAGSTLPYSTYLGGNGTDVGANLVVDASGNAYVIGQTTSTDFPVELAYQGGNSGGIDVFITAIDTAGTALVYSTYFGGSSTDSGARIALGLNGNVFVTGSTNSANFPAVAPFQGTSGGGTDAFVAQLSAYTVGVTGVAPSGVIDPTLSFALSSYDCDLGTFSPAYAVFCNHTMRAATNAPGGYTISYMYTGSGPIGPIIDLPPMTTPDSSTPGTEQFGMNLATNTAAGASTLTDFGAGVSGGSGTVASDYDTGDIFKFDPNGDVVAESATASMETTYTASYIANVQPNTPAGYYAVGMRYIITPNF